MIKSVLKLADAIWNFFSLLIKFFNIFIKQPIMLPVIVYHMLVIRYIFPRIYTNGA